MELKRYVVVIALLGIAFLVQKLNIPRRYFVPALLRAVLLPLIKFKLPFDKNRGTFLEVFGAVLARLAPYGYVNEANFLLPIITAFILAIGSHPETGYRLA